MNFVLKQKHTFSFQKCKAKIMIDVYFWFSKNVRRRVWRQRQKCEDLGDK